MSFLEITKLAKSFGNTKIFKDINLSIEQGEFVVFLGPSGCGKSTLLNCVAGLLNFDDGEISIAGKNMEDIHPSKRDIAMVFQSYALYPNMTVRGNITFGMKIRKRSPEVIKSKVAEISEMLNIGNLLDRKPSELSGGQQQRVAIARALVRDPKLFLFDEPLSNLDAKLRVKMRTEIRRLHRRLKTTIVYVTHDQVEAMTMADKIAVMNEGNVMQYGTPKEIYFEPENVFVAEFIGSPPMNMFPSMIKKSSEGWGVEISCDNKKFFFKLPPKRFDEKELKKYLDKEILLGIRPENIHLEDKARKKTNSVKKTLPLKVDFIEPNGADNLIVFDFNGEEIISRLHSDIPAPEEGLCNLILDLDKCWLYDKETNLKIGV